MEFWTQGGAKPSSNSLKQELNFELYSSPVKENHVSHYSRYCNPMPRIPPILRAPVIKEKKGEVKRGVCSCLSGEAVSREARPEQVKGEKENEEERGKKKKIYIYIYIYMKKPKKKKKSSVGLLDLGF